MTYLLSCRQPATRWLGPVMTCGTSQTPLFNVKELGITVYPQGVGVNKVIKKVCTHQFSHTEQFLFNDAVCSVTLYPLLLF